MTKKICVMGTNYARSKKEHQPTLVKLAQAIQAKYNALTPLDIARLAYHLRLPCKTAFDWLADAGIIPHAVWDFRLSAKDRRTLVHISNNGIEKQVTN
ncbi:hypothetical protein ACSYAD_33475 [Acaryochloris marina NIES-2412]|uniref:hypothetical protein n=1 Tax=Acaryochloris marina TaxID=155978 RepID=UPI004058087D